MSPPQSVAKSRGNNAPQNARLITGISESSYFQGIFRITATRSQIVAGNCIFSINIFSNCQKPARMDWHSQSQSRAKAQTIEQETKTMKTNKRFIKSVVETAAKSDTIMPWTRGTRRAAFIAKRNSAPAVRKTA